MLFAVEAKKLQKPMKVELLTDLRISLFLLANFFQVGRHDILNSDVDRVAEQDGGRADDEADALEDKPEVNIKYLKF